MSNLTKAIRAKRFNVKEGSSVELIIETKMGALCKLELINCSLTGVAGILKTESTLDQPLEVGEIIPSSKLVWGSHESGLGRLVLRGCRDVNGKTYLGFSAVDVKIPIAGPLSLCLDVDLQKKSSFYDFELSPEKHSLAIFQENQNDNVDIFAKCEQFSVFQNEWQDSPKFLYWSVREPSKGVRVNLTRKRKNGRNDYIIMGSNDYLGLASNPEVMEAAKAAIDKYGFGSTGSPISTGLTVLHEELISEIGRTFKKEKVILYNSGYAANVGSLTGITGVRDLVVADVLSHASIADGLLMARATSRFFKHNDMKHLDKILSENREAHSGALLVTEGVFSMDGDVPPLNEFVALAKKYHARTFVDEAHSWGVVGPAGLGACAKYQVLDKVDMIMGTFSKVCGGIGGFIATSEDVVDWLGCFSRANMFSVSIAPSTAAAALKAMQIIKQNPELVNQLKTNIKHFTTGLKQLGYKCSDNHESAVIPVVIGDEMKLGKILQSLLDAGIFVVPVVYPAVSRKSCRFRFTVMANHTMTDLDYVIATLERAMADADFRFSDSSDSKAEMTKTAA
jgi:8-amino-7-oxononanoate synthase